MHHRTEIAGFMTILHGDARFYNNIFVQIPLQEGLAKQIQAEDDKMKDVRDIIGSFLAVPNFITGTHPYSDYPTMEGLRVNGNTVKLRGTCIHHDNGMIGAAAIPRAEERRVELLKAAGFNAIRSAHHPISRALLDACDRHGIIVMDELSDMWTRRKTDYDYSTSFPAHWPELVDSMVANDFNHPCVVMYSIGNEILEIATPQGAKLGRQIAERLRGQDPTRYTINSANLVMAVMDQMMEMAPKQQEEKKQSPKNVNEVMTDAGDKLSQITAGEFVATATEESFASVDIAGYNYAASRYTIDKDRFPGRVLCGSETFPKEIGENWEVIKNAPHVIGDFTWTGWDYIGEAGLGSTTYATQVMR